MISNDDKNNDLPWFKNGLRFECRQCGRCCRGKPGAVWVNRKEIEEISAFLGISEVVFARRYLRNIDERLSLLEYYNGDCIMYNNGCNIYAVRPGQCRSFPFWTRNLETKTAWEKVKKACPGIDKGTLHNLKDIQDTVCIYESRGG
ncbi:MAG: YkgJ family cysteine cluster protein [Candidatus Loosdrechtia sp.]|uniref:YkgJ family cysteine cluster protein n=1 Tax=Candidatus Loosdrechtia sp. TaxID=3101272 RepID=UPI003A791715|nr:MAG: YkgJ family cysteine cluster protein [Candidatus Jettenia sp. AMX2]